MSLPPDVDQDAVLEVLRELLAVRGAAELLHAPVLQYAREDFPDEWRPDADGAEAMLRRLLAWAGLGDAPLRLKLLAGATLVLPVDGHDEYRVPLSEVGAYFQGRDEAGSLSFVVDEAHLADAERLAGALAHAAAAAWRAHHHLTDTDDHALEQELSDVASVVLGFGLLTTNNTWRYRRRAELSGAAVHTHTTVHTGGFLSSEVMAWLLAVQATLRGDRALNARLVGALEPSQRITFEESLASLDRAQLWTRLGLPAAETLHFTPPVQPPPRALPTPRLAPGSGDALAPAGAVSFRVPARPNPFVGFFWFVGSIPLAILTHAAWPFLVLPGAYVAFRLARPLYRCAACDALVSRAQAVCAGCRASLVGDIARLRDKHDAESEWHARHGRPDVRAAEHDLEQLALTSEDDGASSQRPD